MKKYFCVCIFSVNYITFLLLCTYQTFVANFWSGTGALNNIYLLLRIRSEIPRAHKRITHQSQQKIWRPYFVAKFFLRLTFSYGKRLKFFHFYALSVKFMAVLRLPVNPIETLFFICFHLPMYRSIFISHSKHLKISFILFNMYNYYLLQYC